MLAQRISAALLALVAGAAVFAATAVGATAPASSPSSYVADGMTGTPITPTPTPAPHPDPNPWN